jgi:hypothetical protein
MATAELCSICSELDLDSETYTNGNLGSFEEMLKKSRRLGPDRSGCAGCAFFCEIIQTSDRWKHRASELPGCVVDLNMLRLDVKTPERVKSSRWVFDDLFLERCIVDGEPGMCSHLALGRKVMNCSSDQEADTDCKRPVTVAANDPSCFKTILSWLGECAEHAECARPAPVRLPKRVIEVPIDASEAPKLRVTNGNQFGQYVILSHCWGSARFAKLTDKLLVPFQDAIPLEQLPKNFEDAIKITRQLGFCYLWIDALCISQDNAADWNEEAPKMASYYGQSTLMIAATTAEDSSKGILNNRHVPYSSVIGKEKKYCLRQKLVCWAWDIERSVLASRGWAAQERMLAPRVLHYTRRQMIWECAKDMTFEASGIKNNETGPGLFDMQFSKSNLQPYVTKGLKTETKVSGENSAVVRSADPALGSDLSQDTRTRVRTWQQCVDEYAKRDLTVSSDKLHAISGVAAILNQDGQMGHYMAGIWSKFLAVGLAWIRQWALFTSPPAYRAPSWSWASVDGESSSLMLGSTPELLNLPTTEIGRKWAARFDLELIEHRMILHDQANVYGAVLEGSYIILDCTCLLKEDLNPLMRDDTVLAFDKSNVTDCKCCGPRGPNEEELVKHSENMQKNAHFDLGVFMMADVWREPDGFVDILLLEWVDQEERVARRTGIMRIRSEDDESEVQPFSETFFDTAWQRLRLKLV